MTPLKCHKNKINASRFEGLYRFDIITNLNYVAFNMVHTADIYVIIYSYIRTEFIE